MTGVRTVKVDGYDDDALGWRVLHADLSLYGAQEKRIVLRNPDSKELRNGKHIRIEQFGKLKLIVINPDGSWSQSVDVGGGGEFAHLFSPPVANIKDLVDRYDEIEVILAKAAASTHSAKDGRKYELRIMH
jgi:hypothetical protein